MSDIENNTNDLNINTTIDGNAASGTAELSAELVNLTKQLQQLSQAAVKQANVTQSWNQAMGMSRAGVSQYSQQLNSSINVITKLSNATKIYKDVLNEAKKSTEGFVQAQSLINSNKGGLDASFVQRYNAGLVQGQNHLSSMTSGSKDLEKAMKRVALIDISRNIQRGAQAEAQSAYTFTRNFSAPIIGGLREAFFSYSKLASESVRTTKLILDNFSNMVDGSTGDTIKQMAAATAFTEKLGKGLDKITQTWGTSRVLVQALAGDFAELGITSDELLTNMTRLTVEAEKLGNLDIAQSSSFLTSMYQTILRIRRETGKSVNINDAVVSKDIMEQLSGQLAVFNLIENKTVMSLRNISDAFPEVTAAATSFGLSMSEATALIIPMIGAGFQVGASANSLKVSLQRMVAMTKQNTEILNQLNQSLGNGFELSAGVGMEQIQKLSDAYGFLVRDVAKGGKGKQGALELFSRLFGVRQGPRMESAFAQLNAFQTQLETTGSAEQKVAKQLQDSVNAELKAIGQKEINIKQFKDLSTLHRQAIASDEKGNLTAQAAAIQKGQIAAQRILEKAGGDQADFISEMSTEVGKALITQAFDTKSLAGRQYDLELKLSQNTPEVRYRRAKESMLALGRAIVPVVDSVLKVLLPAFQKLSSFLQNNPAVAKLTGAFLLLAAAAGPIKLAFATMKTVFGSAIGLFVKLAEKVTGVSYAFASLQDLMSNPDLLRGQSKVVQYLDNFLIKTKRNGKALRKEMDLSGLSQPVQEMFKGNKAAAIYGTDRAVNMKRLSPIVPETSQFLNDMKTLNIENSTQMAAKVAESSEKGIAKGTEGFSEKFQEAAAKAMHRFQGPNLFAGPNYFENNIPGTGDGGGPRVVNRGGGGGKAAAKIAAEQATVTAATQSTFQKNIKRQIATYFINPTGIGRGTAGGPTPVNTADGLLSATKGALAAVKGQSSSSPPGGTNFDFKKMVAALKSYKFVYDTPGAINIGTTGTSGVLLSTLEKIKEGMPKSMSGRIVRFTPTPDPSDLSYGFPSVGPGRIPYPKRIPLPKASEHQLFPIEFSDKLRRQMSLAPKALMRGPAPSPRLSLASLGEMFSQAGVELEAQLVHALSGPESFPVSQKAINEVKKIVKRKTGFFSLALSKTGVNETMGGKLITLFSGINYTKGTGALVQREMAPILEHLNQNITDQVDAGLETIPQAAMKRLNEIKREITPLGLQALPIRTMKKITTAGGTTQYTPILLKDFMHALDSHFISIEDEVQGVIQVANNGLANDLMATQNLFPDVSSQGLVKHPITGQIGTGSTNIHGDMIAQIMRDVEAGRTTLIQGVDEFGRETVQIVQLAGKSAERVVDETVKVYGDLTDLDKKVKFTKGKDIPITETDKIKTVESKIKELKENARKAKGASKITALKELDDYIFEQEKSITLLRRVEAQNIAQSKYKDPEGSSRIMSEIANKRRKLEIIKREQAAGIAAGKIPTTSADLKRLDAAAAARILAKQEEIAAEKAMISALPAANPRKKAPGLAKLAKPHEQKIKRLEAELLSQIGQRKALLDSPAAIESDIENLLEKMVLAKPADLSDVEKLIESERKKLNTSLKRTGNRELKRRASRRTTSAGLKDFIKGLYQPVSVVGANLEDDVNLMTKAERSAKWYRDNIYQYNQGKQVMTGGTTIDRFKSAVMRVPFTTTPTPDTVGVTLPKGRGTRRRSRVAQLRDSILPTLPPSRFFGPQFDQARIPSVTDFYGKPFRLKDYPLKSSFAQRLFKRPKSVGAAAITTGTDIAAQFRDGLESSLNGILKSSSTEVSKITSAIDAVIFNTGHSAAGKKTLAFLQSAVELPDKVINQAMQAAITDITRGFTGGTGAGLAGRGSRAQSPQSLAGFYERLRLGLSGKNARGEATKVKGITEAFFGPDFRALFNKKPGFSDATGVENNLKVLFANAFKNAVVGLGSEGEALSDIETGRRKEREILQASQGRQRSTRGGVQANKKRSGARGGVKRVVDEAVGGVNQELIDVRTQLAGSLQGLLDQKKVIIPDVAAVIEKAVIDPVVQVQKVIDDAVQTAVVSIPGAAAAPAIDNAIQDTLVLSEKQKANVKKAKDKLKGIKDSAAQSLGIKPASVSVDKITERIDKISAAIASNEKDLQDAVTRNMPASSNSIKGPEKRIADFKKEMQKLERFKKQIIDEEAKILANSIPSTAPADISPTNATGRVKPPTGVPVTAPGLAPPVVPAARVPTVGGSDGDGKIFNIDKIGHRFQGPNIFSKNIFDANLKDIIPNFDDLMAAPVAGATAVAVAGETAGVAITEGAAAMTAASAVIKQSAISKALFGNKALKGQFAAGAEKSVIESLFGSKMAKKNIIPKYVTEKLEDGTEKTLLSSVERRRSLLPFGRIPIGLPIKQELADVDKLLTKGVLPNFARLKKLLTGFLGKTWLFALSGGLSVLIGPLTKVIKNFGGLKQVLSGTGTAFVQAGKGIKGVAAGAGQITSNVFGGIQKAATVGLNIFAKLAGAILLVGTGLLIIVPIIGILIALYGMFKSANGRLAGAATALKEAFKALVDGAKALFAPVRDLIFVFTGADKQMGGLTSEGQKNAAFFTIIANAIKKATTAFKEWAETIGAAFVKNTVVPQITRIINKFILLGSAIKDFSSGDKASGMAKLKAMMFSFAYDIVNIVRIITGALINAFVFAVPVIIQVMQGLLKLLGEMIWAAMKEIGNGVAEGTAVGMIRGTIRSVAGGDTLLKVNDAIYNAFAGSEPAGAGSLASSSKTKTDTKGVEKVIPKQLTKAEAQTKGFIDSMMAIVKSAGVGVDSAFLEMLKSIDSKYTKALSSTNMTVNGINVPIVIDKKSSTGVIDQIAYIAKKSADAATSAGESLGSQIANGIKSKVAEIKDTLKGAFYSNVDEKFDDIVTQYTDALEKQKDQQLKAYDDQITAIDELAAAEERLTDTKDYESRKREIIDKRQYDHENYSVERKLAVYEGRTFDVRRLDREEVASKVESDKSLTDLDSERLKKLQSFQRDLVKGVIANQKDIAEKEFDVILKSFDTFMKGVKNKSFATQEEFAAALKSVADKALSSSLELGTAFETGLAKLPAAIAAVRTPSIALFSSAMGDLIGEAKTSFGVATGSANPASLLGAVGLLVAGSQAGFAAAFSTTFAPLYVKPAVDAITVITGSLSKKGDPNNIAESWKKAGADAFAALEAELNRTIAWEKIFKSFDDLFDGLKPKIKKVVDLAVAAQNALANVGGQTAVSTELDEATMKDFKEVITESAKTYGGGKFGASKASLDIMIDRVAKFIGTHISEGAAGIIASAKDASSGLSVTEKGILTAAVGKLNIGGALNLRANPSAYRTDSGGRSGFGATSEFAPYYPPSGFMYGGKVGRYGIGGYLKAPASQGIPALLHGGEYIINHKAVEKFGKGNLERINNLKNGGDFRGFATGGYMTTPGFANGGYMTTPGFAKGGAVRRNVGNKPKGTDSNQTNNGMRLFTNSNGQSYYVPDTNVRSGVGSGMILHPLDWQAIAVSENGQNWEKSLGKVSRTGKGVFVGALNIARQNWMRFGQGKYGNFNDPLNPPSFENQIKVAEIMYKGLASDPSAWGRAPKYLDGFEGVRLGRVDFPKLSDLSTYNRLKAQGLALGGSVRKYGSADAMERASASPKFIGPMPPVVKPTKQGVFGKIGGFLSKAVTDTVQSFAKVGSGGLNIASALVESPLALLDKRLSFNPITNLQRRNQDQIDNGINYIRGINKITGLNIPGGKTGGLGQIAGGKLTNFGDAFNVITSIPGLGSGLKIAPTIGKLVVGRMGLSATEMTLGQIMKPGVMAVVNNALTREAAALAGRGALQGFDSTILNPANIIDTQIVRPRLALPPAPSQIPKVVVEDVFGDGLAPRMSGVFAGPGGAEDKLILDLFDEMDAFGSGVTNKLPTITRREMLRAQLQVSGAIPKVMQSPEDLAFYNMMLDNLLGLGDNARGVSGVDPEAFGEIKEIFDSLSAAASKAFTPKNLDPRISPASREVYDYQFLMQDIGKSIQDLLRDSDGVIPPNIRASVTEALGYRPKTGNMMEEFPFMHLPIGNQPLISGELLRSRFDEALSIANALRDQMALAPRALGMGTKGGALAIPSIMEGSGIPRQIFSRTLQIGDDALTQSFDAWKIGLEEVSFGVNRSKNPFTNLYETANQYGSTMPSNEYPGLDWLNNKLVKNIPLNPYDISGESEFTEVGRGVANLWANAHVGYKFENPAIGNKDTFVSALLYARSKGDLKAKMEMQRLADIGKDQVEKFRLSYNPAPTGNDLLMYQKSIKEVGLSDFTPEDLFLVHETPYKPFIDQFGNAVIRPTSDYQTLFPNDGYPMEYVRDTVHFALNHPVMGHGQRESVKEPYLLVANFMDAMKANPGSLSSLYPVDTVLTPALGRGLVFPKGTYQLHEKPVSTYGAVKESLAQMMNPSKIDSSYFKHIFKGGDHGSDMGTNQFAYQMARNMNVGSGPHFGSPTQIISGLQRGADIGIGQYLDKYMMQGLSDNDITRLLARTDLFNSIRTNIKYTGPDRFYSGGYMPKFKKGGYLNFKEGGEVPSILHGGEYVLNAGAVKKYGLAHIEAMNKMRFNVPQQGFSVPQSSFSGNLAGGMTTSTQNVNIYVDNFIGEPEWFNSMMKDYNTTVLPRNQKAAGLESRVISTYSGLNRGN